MKKGILIAAAVLAVAVIGIIIYQKQHKQTEEYPEIACIDDVLWYNTGKICEQVPRQMPDGTIETFVAQEIMPDMYNSANFGSEYGTLEYMTLETGEMIIHVGENWYYMEQR